MYVDEDAIKKLLYSTSTCAWHFSSGCECAQYRGVWAKVRLLRLGKCRFAPCFSLCQWPLAGPRPTDGS